MSNQVKIKLKTGLWTTLTSDVSNQDRLVSLYLYVPDEGSLLPKYRDCTTSNDFELYLMCCGVMLQYIYIYIYIFRPV